jgi:Zn-dependent M16 (insulinase) family peptidase
MNPDETFVQKEADEVQQQLAAIQAKLTEQQKKEIISLQKELKVRQEMKQDVSILPTLTLADIPKTTQKTETIKKKSKGIDVTWVPQPTNGLIYYRGLVPIPDIPNDLLLYLPLFTTVCNLLIYIMEIVVEILSMIYDRLLQYCDRIFNTQYGASNIL